jgi:ketosteroid isomerase-like protein
VAELTEVVRALHEVLLAEDGLVDIDDEASGERIAEVLREVAEPDFECVMVASGGGAGLRAERRGVGGFLDSWRDWAGAFDRMRIEPERLIETGDRVVELDRMSGTPRGTSAEVVNRVGAVWTFSDGRLSRVEFHLDRAEALRAAGLDPQSSQE